MERISFYLSLIAHRFNQWIRCVSYSGLHFVCGICEKSGLVVGSFLLLVEVGGASVDHAHWVHRRDEA